MATAPADAKLRRRRLFLLNLLGAMPVAAWFGVGALASLDHLRLMPDLARQTLAGLVQTVADAASLTLFAALILLLLIRRTPVASLEGVAPRAAAALGFAFPFVLLAFPPDEAGDGVRLLGASFKLAGALLALVSLCCLGRSFSIFPQARALATSGAYGIVRHPLYLCELIIFLGAALERAGAWSLALAPLAVLVQLPRMRFEERLLAETFPAYTAYARRTPWRLLPGLY